jgi:hypothetical protein
LKFYFIHHNIFSGMEGSGNLSQTFVHLGIDQI